MVNENIVEWARIEFKEFCTVYHKSYQEHEPVTIRIEKDKIEITSVPGPDKSISDDER